MKKRINYGEDAEEMNKKEYKARKVKK